MCAFCPTQVFVPPNTNRQCLRHRSLESRLLCMMNCSVFTAWKTFLLLEKCIGLIMGKKTLHFPSIIFQYTFEVYCVRMFMLKECVTNFSAFWPGIGVDFPTVSDWPSLVCAVSTGHSDLSTGNYKFSVSVSSENSWKCCVQSVKYSAKLNSSCNKIKHILMLYSCFHPQ